MPKLRVEWRPSDVAARAVALFGLVSAKDALVAGQPRRAAMPAEGASLLNANVADFRRWRGLARRPKEVRPAG